MKYSIIRLIYVICIIKKNSSLKRFEPILIGFVNFIKITFYIDDVTHPLIYYNITLNHFIRNMTSYIQVTNYKTYNIHTFNLIDFFFIYIFVK